MRLTARLIAVVAAVPLLSTIAPCSAFAASESVIYSFQGGSDGLGPDAGLTLLKNNLYGTTGQGGTFGMGTAFQITTVGSENVLHSFSDTNGDGGGPYTLLTVAKGGLFGTTTTGGRGDGCSDSCGTVFLLHNDGTDKVLHTFSQGTDGSGISNPLTNVGNVLYGVTSGGGNNSAGVFFSISVVGKETVLHKFASSEGAGLHGLVFDSGSFYGTATGGGAHGYGSVFALSPDGTETTLYSFTGPKDAIDVLAPLIVVDGTLYGVSFRGGENGNGSVFKVTKSGKEKIIYSFGPNGVGDGINPVGGLIYFHGMLYGTTSTGGVINSGTVFSVTLKGEETIVYSFLGPYNGHTDGEGPFGTLINIKGVLYGTTISGGSSTTCNSGCGTVFKITP